MDAGFVVLLTVGFQGAGRKRPGQLVKATIVFAGGNGEEPVSFHNDGKYLNDRADAKLKRRCWRVVKRTLSAGDSVRVEVFTGVKGAGEDTQLTGAWIYVLTPTEPIRDVYLPGIGPRGVPILKGRFAEVAAVTKRDQLQEELQQFLADETGM
jgi:hypothetical protein